MAIPTTQKECTTRRIAALIIGLWDKIKNAFLLKTSRGAANGVASLDANGKVPSSQLPTVPQKGSEWNPVYVDGNGTIQECIELNHRWNATTKAKTWSRLAYVKSNNVYGSTLILDIACSGVNVVNNATFLIKTAHPGIDASRIIELGSVYYLTTKYRIRLVTSNYSNSYIEIYDESNNASTGTEQAWICTMKIIQAGEISYYTAFTDGTTLPSGYTAGQEIYVRKSTSGKLVTANGSIGTTNLPVYVDSDGNLAQCTNVPVIEHVTTIPVNPTVGTIYAL